MKFNKYFARLVLSIYFVIFVIPIIVLIITIIPDEIPNSNIILEHESDESKDNPIFTDIKITNINPINGIATINIDIESPLNKNFTSMAILSNAYYNILSEKHRPAIDKFLDKHFPDKTSEYLISLEIDPLTNIVKKIHSFTLSRRVFTMPETAPIVDRKYNSINDINLEFQGQSKYYPFDTYKGTIVINFDPSSNYTSKYYTDIQFRNLDRNFILAANPKDLRRSIPELNEYEFQNYVDVYLKRDNFTRYYLPACIFLLYLTIIVFTLLISFSKKSELILMCVAVLSLALVIRSFTTPNNIPIFCIFDYIHMSFFLAIFIIMLFKGFKIQNN
ncbi:hypothetical protein [Paenibacillus sp. GXUN7292]|uniref:hypothetical protein n=1 Tax=Paenibacillus sp. GXUN7292 TaxID=3422499 RepID=UPI003D7EB032